MFVPSSAAKGRVAAASPRPAAREKPSARSLRTRRTCCACRAANCATNRAEAPREASSTTISSSCAPSVKRMFSRQGATVQSASCTITTTLAPGRAGSAAIGRASGRKSTSNASKRSSHRPFNRSALAAAKRNRPSLADSWCTTTLAGVKTILRPECQTFRHRSTSSPPLTKASSNPPCSRKTSGRMSMQAAVTARSSSAAVAGAGRLPRVQMQRRDRLGPGVGEDHAAVLDRAIGVEQLAADDRHRRIGLDLGDHRRQPTRRRLGVVVEEQQILGRAPLPPPWFDALAKPRLAVLRAKRMLSSRGNACAVSSLEALSMTITSWATSRVFSATAIRHFQVSSHLLKTGMTIETVGVVAVGSTCAQRVAKPVPPIRRD